MRFFISQRVFTNQYGATCDLLEGNYVSFFRRHGFNLIPISNFLADSLDNFLKEEALPDGLILSGGNDINTSIEREQTEARLLNFALEKKLPILGICRGMHFLNASFGGTLVQDIVTELKLDHPPAVEHPVSVIEPRAQKYLGLDSWLVNSYHRQAVTPDRLASPLKAFAVTPDQKIIEGLYHPDLPVAGVQFHPERPFSRYSPALEKLIDAFKRRDLYWKK